MASDAALDVPAVVERVLADIADKEGFRQPRFAVQSGSGARDGYTSALFRAKISDKNTAGRKDELSLMVKTSMPIFAGLMPKMYAAEARIYEVVLPAMKEVARLASLDEPLPWPRCLHAALDVPPPLCLVLVDMKPDGYAMSRNRAALDATHCRLALASLARFHGAGLALQHLRPDEFRAMHAPLENAFASPELRNFLEPFINGLLKSPFADSVKARFPKDSHVPAIVKRLFTAFKEDKVALMGHREPGSGYTIIHDDSSINNIMFQYDSESGEVKHCRLIDFQTATYGCPALDVVYLLLTGTEKAVRAKGVWEGLLRGYHDGVQDTLRRAGVADPDAVYSWTLFQAQLRRVMGFGLAFAPMMYTGLCGDDDKILEVRESIASSDGKKQEKEVESEDLAPLVNDYTLSRYGDLVEDVVRWGMLPSEDDIERWLRATAAAKSNSSR